MSDIPEKQRGVSWLVTLGAVLLLAAYVGGYFVLCERTTYAIPNFTACLLWWNHFRMPRAIT